MPPNSEDIRRAIEQWYRELPRLAGGFPARGSVAVGLTVIDRLLQNGVIDPSAIQAAGGAQVKGASAAALKRILAAHGETRVFLVEGGRTNRGSPAAARALLERLRETGLDSSPEAERAVLLLEAQRILVGHVQEQMNSKRLELDFDPSATVWEAVHKILAISKVQGKAPTVAQHVVGAKLAIRFPEKDIENNPASAADASGGRSGDFLVGDTVFHVTVSPGQLLMEKCRRNLSNGKRPFILVPHERMEGARQQAEEVAAGKIEVGSIESFVAQNVSELSEFDSRTLMMVIRRLIEKYNSRVDIVESDKAVMIEIPAVLRRIDAEDE